MFFLIYLTLMNSWAAQYDFINVYRFNFGGILVGTWEISLFVGCLLALFLGDKYAEQYPNARTHKALKWTMLFMLLGFFAGLAGALIWGTPMKYALSSSREYVAFPVCIWLGYRLTPSPDWIKRFFYVLILAGLITSTVLMLHFGENAERAGIRNNINYVRSVQYVSAIAGIAALLLCYSVASGNKLMPTMIALPLAGYCLVGQFSPMHRNEWVAVFCGFAVMFLLLPKGRRIAAAGRGMLLMVIMLVFLWGGVEMASKLTQRDFMEKVQTRLVSLLPSERGIKDDKAWDSRLPGIQFELALWAKNPFMGQGFGAQEGEMMREGQLNYGTNHNGWASTLAKCGIMGFIGSMLFLANLLIVGWRMTRDAPDRTSALCGALAAMSGAYLLIQVLSTMSWTTREAMLFGTVCGIMFRCRDMQPTTAALQYAAESADGYHLTDAPDWIGVEGSPPEPQRPLVPFHA